MKQLHANNLLLIALLVSGYIFASENHQTVQGFSLISDLDSDHIIQFNIPTYELEDVEVNGQVFKRLNIDGSGKSSKIGEPELPTVTTFYAIDPGKTYEAQVTIISSEIIQNVDILPMQSWESDITDKSVGFKRNIQTYTQRDKVPARMVVISEPATFRNLELVSVEFTPFQYTPLSRELEVITSAEIQLIEIGSRSEGHFRPQKQSRIFEKLYESMVVNYDTFSRGLHYQKPSILYILPSNSTNLMSTLDLLFNWRHKSGYEVNVVTTNTTGSSNASIKDYIQNAYETWSNPPEYVALVGDASGTYSIPTYFDSWSSYNGEGDHPYSQLEGNDLFPEVLIGRISFSTTTELATIINKTIQYETNPYMGENWFTRACMVGDPSISGISCVITNEVARQYIEGNGHYDDVRTVYSGSFPTQMVSNLNDGLTFFNYRGYYGVSGFTNGNISSLNNGFKLCVATVITCGTGSFASGTSMSEAFIRAGTPSQPKGAVASIGTATIGTHTMFNNAVDLGFYYGAFVDGLDTPSAALARGKLHLFQTYPSDPNNFVSIFTHWNNLMGDPALKMWTDVPKYFNVTYHNSIPRGTNFINAHVSDSDGNNIQEATVTILKGFDEIFESGMTDANGNITLPISVFSPGNMSLTVTKKNYIPHQGMISISDPANNLNSLVGQITTDDDDIAPSNGNGDGLMSSGEMIELTIPVHNFGTEPAFNVVGSLSALSNHVTVTSGTVNYGSIDTSETIDPGESYVIQIGNNVYENESIELLLNIQDSTGNTFESRLEFNTVGSFLDIIDVSIIDGGEGILYPGETANLQFTILNTGSMDAVGVTGALNTNLPALNILSDQSSWGTIPVGQAVNSTDYFTVSADEGLLPGTLAHLFLTLSGNSGFSTTKMYTLQIGTATVTDPLGPDEHGYYIYDSGDQIYSNAPFYNWIEINPNAGGNGTLIPINDSGNNGDDVHTMALPFSFRMYGQAYNDITICSNGWISMGSTGMQSFRNYPIPGPGGPSPMIAAFWDDLITQSNGHIYSYNDSEAHQFIIEWSQVRTYDVNSLETFQVILRDPSYYFTPTGDGEILIQYHTFNNTSAGNYSWGQVHGAYSTIGIEDPTATRGLQYTFNNQYPSAAMPLSDETAILITTRGSDIRMRGDVNQDGLLDVADVLILVDFILTGNTSTLNPYLADMNQDDIINILDMIGIVQLVMGY